MPLPTATIRTQVSVRLRFADGYSTTARGYLLYLRQEGRGIGRADALALGVSRVALLSNNPDKARQLRRFGVTVAAQVPTGVHLSATNARYLATNAHGGAHTLDVRCRQAESPCSASR